MKQFPYLSDKYPNIKLPLNIPSIVKVCAIDSRYFLLHTRSHCIVIVCENVDLECKMFSIEKFYFQILLSETNEIMYSRVE